MTLGTSSDQGYKEDLMRLNSKLQPRAREDKRFPESSRLLFYFADGDSRGISSLTCC